MTATSAASVASKEHPSRRWQHFGTASLLLFGFFLLRGATWTGSVQVHTLLEVLATTVALVVGAMALVRYRTGRGSIYLLVGTGFLGTGALDAYHAVVTSTYFQAVMPSPPPSLIPWSWSASRLFLALLLLLSWIIWRREARSGAARVLSEHSVYIGGAIFTLLCFLFFAFVPLPQAYFSNLTLGRPQELLPGSFLLIALVGYWTTKSWCRDSFQHWLVLSLIVGTGLQAPYMASSFSLFDAMFDAAHNLKIVSYLCVFAGLLTSTHEAYQAVDHQLALIEEKQEQLISAQDTLRQQHEQMRIYFDKSVTGLAVTSLEKGWIRVNPAIIALLGYSENELKALSWAELTHPEDLEKDVTQFERLVRGDIEGYQLEKRFLHKDGRVLHTLISVSVSRLETGEAEFFIAQIADIGDQKLATEERIRLEKFGALGQLTAGVAHELNNPLMGIINYAQFCLTVTDPEDERHEVLTDIERETRRCIEVVKNLLAFSRTSPRSGLREAPTDVLLIIKQVLRLIDYRLRKNGITSEVFVGDDLGLPRLEKDAFQQVYLNLVSNAIDAMENSAQKVLTTRVRWEDTTFILEVSDTGEGISDENKLRIFDPFFTTKPQGKGTGLGLSTCISLIDDSYGHIRCHSQLGRGTTMEVRWDSVRSQE